MRGYIDSKEVIPNGFIIYRVQGSTWPAYHRFNVDMPVPFSADLEKGNGDYWLFGMKEKTETKECV